LGQSQSLNGQGQSQIFDLSKSKSKIVMTYSMKSENKLEGASNFRARKTRIDLILAKNKVLDIMKGKTMEPQFETGKEKEP